MSVKILTVDHSKTIRMIIKKALRSYDCTIFEAENGVEGLVLAVRETPDLIILDITMPVMNGIVMLEKLKLQAPLANIPIIMLTSESGKDSVMDILKKGVEDYMVKPFKGDDLIERAGRVVDLQPKSPGPVSQDTPNQYFKCEGDVHVLALPAKINRAMCMDIGGYLKAQLKNGHGSAIKNIVLDLGSVSENTVSLIKLVIMAIQLCHEARVTIHLVASEKQANELQAFQEAQEVPVVHSVQDAIAAF